MARKEVGYFSIGILIAIALLAIYFLNFRLTGFAVVMEGYENQTACEAANYSWYNELCYDEQPVCDVGFLELCLDEPACTEAGGYWYDDLCNVEEEAFCDADHLGLCNETECADMGGSWYDDLCNAEEEPFCINDVTLCLDESNCTAAGGYWYDANSDGNSTCNSEEECVPKTCASLGYECGSASDGCGGTLSCGTCESGKTCSSGSCRTVKETATCGDGTCNGDETCSSCEADCGTCAVPYLKIHDINIILNPADSKDFNLIAENTGDVALSGCGLVAGGEASSWISVSGAPQNFNVGKQQSFPFSVNVPEDAEEKDYSFSLSVECSSYTRISNFVIHVVERTVDFNLTKVERIRKDKVRVNYFLEDLSGEEQIVDLEFLLLDIDDLEVSNASVNHTLDANDTKRFRIIVPINESLEGNLTLSVSLNLKEYSSSVNEPIILRSPTGFLIFEGMGAAGNVAVILAIALVIVAVFFILKRYRHPFWNKSK